MASDSLFTLTADDFDAKELARKALESYGYLLKDRMRDGALLDFLTDYDGTDELSDAEFEELVKRVDDMIDEAHIRLEVTL